VRAFTLAFICGSVLVAADALAEAITVTDTSGHSVRLKQPAQRIVSLAPHLTELLFAAGAGPHVVGVVDYSDYPPEARALPHVGSFANLDLEAIAALKPDLVVTWQSGNRAAQLERLTALGLPVYIDEPKTLEDIARSLETLGQLAGTRETAQSAAQDFRTRLADLQTRYATRPRVRTFYQVWNQPLLTINDQHPIGAVITLCGGENIFGQLSQPAPTVSTEAVLAANPEAIVASGMDEARPQWLDQWRNWPKLTAASAGNLFFIPPDIIQRHTPRLLDGAAKMCEHLEEARRHRSEPSAERNPRPKAGTTH
jgi:iron complex transport system substrate-binding protein